MRAQVKPGNEASTEYTMWRSHNIEWKLNIIILLNTSTHFIIATISSLVTPGAISPTLFATSDCPEAISPDLVARSVRPEVLSIRSKAAFWYRNVA